MTASCDIEFKTVDWLLQSEFESRAVDAFCLAWIKMERQLRKIVANLIFQSSEIDCSHEDELRNLLLQNRSLSHNTFIGAIYNLTGTSVQELLGEDYKPLKKLVESSSVVRDKIFHGQQTGQNLSRDSLNNHTKHIKMWCSLLSETSDKQFGYDGFAGRTSLFKTDRQDLTARVDEALGTVGWRQFAKSFRTQDKAQ